MNYSAAQREALDLVGAALRYQLIDFTAATDLRNQIRAGQVDEVKAALDEITNMYAQLVDSIQANLTNPTKNHPPLQPPVIVQVEPQVFQKVMGQEQAVAPAELLNSLDDRHNSS